MLFSPFFASESPYDDWSLADPAAISACSLRILQTEQLLSVDNARNHLRIKVSSNKLRV